MKRIVVFSAATGDALGTIDLSLQAHDRLIRNFVRQEVVVRERNLFAGGPLDGTAAQSATMLIATILPLRIEGFQSLCVITGVRYSMNQFEISELMLDIAHTLENVQ